MKKNVKTLFSVLILSSLTACGGGSDEGASPSGQEQSQGTSGSTSNYVSGSFKNAVNTGDFWNRYDAVTNNVETSGELARECTDANQEYYFESDRVQVYGSQTFLESDFKEVATLVENQTREVFKEMGIGSFDAFMESRRNISMYLLRDAAVNVRDVAELPADFDEWSGSKQQSWGMLYLSKMTTEEQVDFIQSTEYANRFNIKPEDYVYPKKIRVCLHSSENNFRYGEGYAMGINVAAPSVNSPSGAQQIIKHELVHMVQAGLSYYNSINTLPRWFAEGQAVKISGQEIANAADHYDYDTPSFVFFHDENGYDQQDIYKHYGLAYEYIEQANGRDKIVEMMSSLRDYYQHYNYFPDPSTNEWLYPHEDPYSFVLAWDDAALTDKQGNVMTLEYWVDNYHSVLNQ